MSNVRIVPEKRKSALDKLIEGIDQDPVFQNVVQKDKGGNNKKGSETSSENTGEKTGTKSMGKLVLRETETAHKIADGLKKCAWLDVEDNAIFSSYAHQDAQEASEEFDLTANWASLLLFTALRRSDEVVDVQEGVWNNCNARLAEYQPPGSNSVLTGIVHTSKRSPTVYTHNAMLEYLLRRAQDGGGGQFDVELSAVRLSVGWFAYKSGDKLPHSTIRLSRGGRSRTLMSSASVALMDAVCGKRTGLIDAIERNFPMVQVEQGVWLRCWFPKPGRHDYKCWVGSNLLLALAYFAHGRDEDGKKIVDAVLYSARESGGLYNLTTGIMPNGGNEYGVAENALLGLALMAQEAVRKHG